MWTLIVKQYATVGDPRTKRILNALPYTLLYSLDQVNSNMIKREIQSGYLRIGTDYGSNEPRSAKDQLTLVNDIFEIIAKTSPTDGI